MLKLRESWANREESVTLLLKPPSKPCFLNTSTTESHLAPQKHDFPDQCWKVGSGRVGLELRDSNFITDPDSKYSASLLSTLGAANRGAFYIGKTDHFRLLTTKNSKLSMIL